MGVLNYIHSRLVGAAVAFHAQQMGARCERKGTLRYCYGGNPSFLKKQGGTTYGDTFWTDYKYRGAEKRRLIKHESAHVRQWDRSGLFFGVKYLASYAYSNLRYGNQCHNRYERAAGFRNGRYFACR